MSKSHMGIESISIRDFRGIDQLDLSFLGPDGYPTQIVVLAGPNGCGKTAVLEACMLANGLADSVRGTKGKEAIRVGCEDYQIEVTIRSVGREQKNTCRATSQGHDDLNTMWFTYFSSWRDPDLIGSVSITMGKEGNKPNNKKQNRLEIIKRFLVDYRAHELFPRKDSGKSIYSIFLRDLNRAWREFYPTCGFAAESVSDDANDGFDVFQIEENGTRLSVDMLSSGQLELFVFFGWLVYDKLNSGPLLQDGIILIDEPELHLDPQWHRQLLRALRVLKPKCQVIVATHSPEIYESVRSFERHFLVPSDDPRAKAWQIETAEESG